MREIRLGSTYAAPGDVARAADGAWAPGVLARYAAATLWGDFSAAPSSPARAVAGKWLTGDALLPAPESLVAAAGRGPRAPAFLKAAHWVQAACWLSGGVPTAVDADFPELGLSRAVSRVAARAAVDDLARLWGWAAALYGESVPPLEPLCVTSSGLGRSGWRSAGARPGAQAWVDAYAPCRVDAAAAADTRASTLRPLLERLLGHARFRPGQAEAVAALLEGRDTFVALPTAGGKSVVFRLAGLLRPGVTVVFEPLTALAREQRRALAARGRAAQFLFVSPERLERPRFQKFLRAEAEDAGVALVAYDEAHCAASWGHDFRPAYATLGAKTRRWLGGEADRPPAAALTGTAGPRVAEQAARVLELKRPAWIRGGSARPELSFRVERLRRGSDAVDALERALSSRRPGPGEALIFCPRVDGPTGAGAVARRLEERLGLRAGVYTGRPERGEGRADWETRRACAADALRRGELEVLCCTTAFSLGVDAPKVRRVYRLGLPEGLEALFQEAGRAGRDGRACECVLFLKEWEDEATLWREHRRRFPGERAEAADVEALLRRLGPWGAPRPTRLAFESESPSALARTLARLEACGVVRVAYRAADHFAVDLAEVDGLEAARAAALGHVAWTYREVEPARRASMEALSRALASADPGVALTRALARLAEHEPTEELEVGLGRFVPRHVFGHRAAARFVELFRVVVEAARPGHALR